MAPVVGKPFLKTTLFLAAVLFALSLSANTPSHSSPPPLPIDSTLRVSLITCGPGEIIYELEGHTGLRFKSDSQDMIVNWGLFDFDSPNFLYRFVKGETDYYAGAIPTDYFIELYKRYGRSVSEQELDLTPEEAATALSLVTTNLLPDNRVYRYNYVKDNCATRPLRIIEKAINDTIILGPKRGEFNTFRNEMRTYHKDYPWYQFGIDLALGPGIDYELNNREAAFAPLELARMLEGATVGNPEGRKLVKRSEVLFDGNIPETRATPFFLTPLFVCWVVFIIVALLTWRDLRRGRISKWLDALLFLMFGLAGCLLFFLVFISEHESTSPNYLIFWLNPLCLIVPALIWINRASKIVYSYQKTNVVLIIIMGFFLAIGGQSINTAFIPLILCDLTRSLNYIYLKKCSKSKISM